MPARGDYDSGRRDCDHYARRIERPVIIWVRSAIVRVKRMPVIVAVVAVVIDVFPVMVVGIRGRGRGQSHCGQ